MAYYTHLSAAEREEISRLLAGRESLRQIGKRLRRSTSTISRESRRVSQTHRSYRAHRADLNAWMRSHRPRRERKLDQDLALRGYVLTQLKERWSPQQIAKRLREDYPDDRAMWISHETIYQYLYVLGRGSLKKELVRCLRRKRKPTRQKRQARRILSEGIPEMISIEERPPEVEDRSLPGHWEGDLLMGGMNRSALGVLVERQTRFLLLAPLGQRDAESVREAFTQAIQRLPATIRKSLTYDRGSEMQGHKRLTMDTNMTVYFCHPHSPWERGTCENTNGLLRQYFPKGIDFNRVPLGEIQTAERQMNGRPRKVLNWRTPSEALNQVLHL